MSKELVCNLSFLAESVGKRKGVSYRRGCLGALPHSAAFLADSRLACLQGRYTENINLQEI